MTNGAPRSSIICVVGARPNFMKIAPIMDAMQRAYPPISARLVHTGQHYDMEMNHSFFDQLGIPVPDVNLEVGSASHAQQTAEIMRRFESVLARERASAVVVVGDVNSTIACALVAAKMRVPVIHVEAGLRSWDRTMPEEINRVLTDQLAELLFTTERDAESNLTREGIEPSRIHFVGNVMIDTLLKHLPATQPPDRILAAVGADAAEIGTDYALLTLHRPSNVDNPGTLERLLATMREISERLPLVFPLHPRTRVMVERANLGGLLDAKTIVCTPPLGYLEMLGLMRGARVVFTDSGGIQEETTALGVPCLTLRDNTERPITVSQGTNTVVGSHPRKILEAFQGVMGTNAKRGRIPELWDGQASERIAKVLNNWLNR